MKVIIIQLMLHVSAFSAVSLGKTLEILLGFNIMLLIRMFKSCDPSSGIESGSLNMAEKAATFSST